MFGEPGYAVSNVVNSIYILYIDYIVVLYKQFGIYIDEIIEKLTILLSGL